MPLVEETRIVVLRLTPSPHVKALVHDNESHGVAHIEQFRRWRVMAGTNSIDPHSLEFHQFAVKRVLMECSS